MFALCPMAIQCHLNRDLQVALSERFEQIPIGLADLRAPQCFLVRVRRQEDDGNPEPAANQVRGGGAIHLAAQPNIHKYEIGRVDFCEADRVLTRGGRPHHLIAEMFETRLQVECDDALILDDEDARPRRAQRGHAPSPRGNVMTASVPLWPPSAGGRNSSRPPSCSVNVRTSCSPSVTLSRGTAACGNPIPVSRTRSS